MQGYVTTLAMLLAFGSAAALAQEAPSPEQPKSTASLEAKLQQLTEQVAELQSAIAAQRQAVTRVYNLEGIVHGGIVHGAVRSNVLSNGQLPEEYGNLMALIQSRVAPNSWECKGGQGKIAAFDTNCSLVVVQTAR